MKTLDEILQETKPTAVLTMLIMGLISSPTACSLLVHFTPISFIDSYIYQQSENLR